MSGQKRCADPKVDDDDDGDAPHKRTKSASVVYSKLVRPNVGFGLISAGRIVACVTFVEHVIRRANGSREALHIHIPLTERFASVSGFLRNALSDMEALPVPSVRDSPPPIHTFDTFGSGVIHPSFRGPVGLAKSPDGMVAIDRSTSRVVPTFPMIGRSIVAFVDMLGLVDIVCGAVVGDPPDVVKTPERVFADIASRAAAFDVESLHSIAQSAEFFDVSFPHGIADVEGPRSNSLVNLCARLIGDRVAGECGGRPPSELLGYMRDKFSFITRIVESEKRETK
jgi:hypothetical protein